MKLYLMKFMRMSMEKWIIFGPKIITSKLFFKSINQIFLKLNLMTGIEKWVKLTVMNFERKFTENEVHSLARIRCYYLLISILTNITKTLLSLSFR